MAAVMKPAGLYVHVPFCLKKCSYCSFCSIEHDPGMETGYRAAVLSELKQKTRGADLRTFYAGGGTPSLLPPEYWRTFLNELGSIADINAINELTIETNPGIVLPEGIQGLRQVGFNRLSIGIQSFSPEELKVLGRIHSPDQASEALIEARSAGFDNIGIDLIYGIPGQDLHRWENNLKAAVQLMPEHISCYELSLEPGTPLHDAVAGGEVIKPKEEICIEMYFLAHSILTDAGYLHYEVSNYALGTDFISKHNTSYWDRTPYFGLGPSAHSFNGGFVRSWNTSDISNYITILSLGNSLIVNSESLSVDDMVMEMLMLGLRWQLGFDMEHLLEATGHTVNAEHLDRMIAAGRVTLDGSSVIPTALGMLYADGDAVGLIN